MLLLARGAKLREGNRARRWRKGGRSLILVSWSCRSILRLSPPSSFFESHHQKVPIENREPFDVATTLESKLRRHSNLPQRSIHHLSIARGGRLCTIPHPDGDVCGEGVSQSLLCLRRCCVVTTAASQRQTVLTLPYGDLGCRKSLCKSMYSNQQMFLVLYSGSPPEETTSSAPNLCMSNILHRLPLSSKNKRRKEDKAFVKGALWLNLFYSDASVSYVCMFVLRQEKRHQ